jgi:taurine dioxygenase
LVQNLPPFSAKERAAAPPVVHPLLREHPETGQRPLYLGCHAREIVGMDLDQGRALLRELEDWTTQPQFVYRHKWRHGDFVIWNNHGTMHRVAPYDASVHSPRDAPHGGFRESITGSGLTSRLSRQ